MQKITPCLWFDGQAKEAAEFYCSIFKNSKILTDSPMVVTFELGSQRFMGLNGGPKYTPNPSVSFYVVCETKDEVEEAWNTMIDGGSVLMPVDNYPWSKKYGWLQDKFGVSWQLSYGKLEDVGQKFTPTLMFANQQAGKAEQAIQYYTSVFDGSSVVGILKYGANDNEVEGAIAHAQFKLGGQVFMAMDSSKQHQFNFTEGVSFMVNCETQKEVDYFWNNLVEDGQESMCGWLKDKYGLSWQIIPTVLGKLMQDKDPKKSKRVIEAMLTMKKIEIGKLQQAYDQQ